MQAHVEIPFCAGALPHGAPLAWHYRDTGSSLAAAPGDPAEILGRELMP